MSMKQLKYNLETGVSFYLLNPKKGAKHLQFIHIRQNPHHSDWEVYLEIDNSLEELNKVKGK